MPDMKDQQKLPLGEELICPLHPVYYGVRASTPAREPYVPDGHRVWLVTRYKDVRAVLADSRVVKDVRQAAALYNKQTGGDRPIIGGPLALHMLNVDPPDHARLRAVVGKAFTEQAVERFRPKIEANADLLLGQLAQHEQVDLIPGYGLPLAIMNTCQLLGLPPSEIEMLNSWAEALPQFYPPDEANEVARGIGDQLVTLLANKRAAPGDDLLTAMINAHDAGEINNDELLAMTYLMIVAGFETSVNLIANSVLALLLHPDQLALLREDPALLPGAVDELLRYDGPAAMAAIRFTTAPVQVGGVEIPEGEFVLVSLRVANRDESRFPDSDKLDIKRAASGHMSFGHGIHYCVGAILGRAEANIAIGKLIERFPDITLGVAPAELTWLDGTIVHNLVSLPVSLYGQRAE
jgi:cytochrome P450